MSTNSLSHLLHTDAVPETHRSPTGSEPSSKYTITSPGAALPLPPPSPRHRHLHQHIAVAQLPPAFHSSVPPPPPLLPTAGSQLPLYPPAPPPASHDNDAGPAPQTSSEPHGTNSHSLTQSLYQCAHCQKRYSRPEHLARHIQTHTLGKRFFCPVCGKGFARADLLKRHAANHDSDNDPTKKRRRTDSSPNAGRVSHACKACAAARVKCEETKPCARCRNRNLNCEYTTTEPGSTAAMHLLHLSQNGHMQSAPTDTGPPAFPVPNAAGLLPPVDAIIPPPTSVVIPEQGQLPTPETAGDQVVPGVAFANPYINTTGMVDMTRGPFSGFLRDVLYEQAFNPGRPEEAHGLAVLDFGDDTNYDLTEMDYGLLDHWNLDQAGGSQVVAQTATPQTDDTTFDMSQIRQKLVKMWTKSPWRWVPDQEDSFYNELRNLPIPKPDTSSQQFQESQKKADRVIKDKLEPSSRDKILSIVLQTLKTDAMRMRIASSFPCAEVMDTMAHVFLVSHLCSVSNWIHWGSLTLNNQWPEWMAAVAAAGAVSTPVPTLRKFGFAIEESIRLALPSRFEEHNMGINNLGLVQALVLVQDIGLWSGNRRKREIAECHLLVPTTMMRCRGKFQRSSYPLVEVEPLDEGDILEEKWKKWHEAESWKRLVFHCYLRGAESSMTTLAPPSISYSELTLPLPEAKELWFARNAVEWKRHYLTKSAGQNKRPPSLPDLIRDISLLTANSQRLDAQFAISIYLHCFWSLILEWRQLGAVHRSNTFSNSYQTGPHFLLNSRHEELCRSLQGFQLVTSDWHASLSAQESLLFNLLMMNLHVSLDDLQLFAGKEGEEQARRVYPILQRWSESTEARQAVWHAGQILRQAKLFPNGHLKDFCAVGVYHAALALWTYGVVVKAIRNHPTPTHQGETVLIDALESAHVQRFIGFGQGRPCIRTKDEQRVECLEDPRSCMDIVEGILRNNFFGEHTLAPAIVENLCQLIRQLGDAALFIWE